MKKPSVFRLISAASIGTILEWYDFSLFAYLTPILAKLFFPQENSLVALMQTYAIFAVGFFVRPLGAILFGHYGDKYGRQKLLVVSIVLMAVPTFLMGLMPTYSMIGFAAPMLLIVLRLLQGLSAGGESTGAVLFVLESISGKYRGFIGGLLWGMTGVGMLLGSFAAAIVASHPQYSWAWRVPFLLGLLTGIIGYFLRKRTSESLMFLEALHERALQKFPLKAGLIKFKKESLIIVGFYILSAMTTYLIFVFMPTYATSIVGLPVKQAAMISTAAFLVSTLLVPIGGYLSDLIGRKKCLFWSALGFVLLSYPLFYLMSRGNIFYFEIAEMIFLILAVGFQGAITATVFELVPTVVRYSVIAVCYNVSYSLFGGSAPFIATYIVNLTGNKAAPGLYLTFGAIVALVAVMQYRVLSVKFDKT